MNASQVFHVGALVLGGAVALAGYYNNMSAAGALGIVIGVWSAIGAYLAGPSPTLPASQA